MTGLVEFARAVPQKSVRWQMPEHIFVVETSWRFRHDGHRGAASIP